MQRTFEARIGNRTSTFTEPDCQKQHRHECPVITVAYNVLHDRDKIIWEDSGHMVMIFDKEIVAGDPQFLGIADKLMTVMRYTCSACPGKNNGK